MCVFICLSLFVTNIAIDMYQILPVALSIYQVPSDGSAVCR